MFRRGSRRVQLVLILAWAGRGNEAEEEHDCLARPVWLEAAPRTRKAVRKIVCARAALLWQLNCEGGREQESREA